MQRQVKCDKQLVKVKGNHVMAEKYTTSIWLSDEKQMLERRKRDRNPLLGDRKIDTVVIGGGMAGILTAYYLQQAGVPVIVLEADRIGRGQTGKTTAKITSQHNLIYDKLIQTFGKERARQYAKANEKAIGEYEKLIQEKNIDCHFTRCPAYLYSRKEREPLKKEEKAALALGIDAEYMETSGLPFSITGALRFKNQAQFHPLEFLNYLADKLTVYEKTPACSVEGKRICTPYGTVTAENIIFAAHFPFINMPGYYFARMYQERSYVVAVEKAAKLEGMYLGIDSDGLSFRSYDGILFVGGGKHRTGESRKMVCRYGMLRKKAEEMWPGCREVTHWSAQDCMTLDFVPYIGRFSKKTPNWYVATGFGKWGMTSSMVSARILTAMIIGQSCPDAEIFSPQRAITRLAAKSFLINGGKTIQGFGKRLLPSEKIYRKEEKKTVAPVCPHLGCRLEWNPEERTYECPCHGSRFDEEGKLMDNPAQKDV